MRQPTRSFVYGSGLACASAGAAGASWTLNSGMAEGMNQSYAALDRLPATPD